MLLKFSVDNFKIFKDKVTLKPYAGRSDYLRDFYVAEPFPKRNVLRLALIYGPNASGKTALVDALNLLKKLVVHPANNKEETLEDVKPFMGDEKSKNGITRLEIDFSCDGQVYSYHVAVDRHCVVEEELKVLRFCRVRSRSSLIYRRQTDRKNRIAVIEFGKGIKFASAEKSSLEHNTLWNNTVLGGYLKTNLSVELLDSAVSWFLHKLKIVYPYLPAWPLIVSKLEKGDIDRTALIAFLRRADFRIEDLKIKKKEVPKELVRLAEMLAGRPASQDEEKTYMFKEIYLKHGTGSNAFYLPLQEESRGTIRFLDLCFFTFLIKDEGCLVVDEMEASLHPELLEFLLRKFLERKDRSQLIATTHYRELMGAEFLREDALWFTEVKEDGSGDLYSFMDFSTNERKKIRSVYNAYRIGKLGGVPQVS